VNDVNGDKKKAEAQVISEAIAISQQESCPKG